MGTEKKTVPEAITAATEKPLPAERIMNHADELPDQLREIAKKYNMSTVDQGALITAAVVYGAQRDQLRKVEERDDKLFRAALLLDRANFIAQDVSERYFECYHPCKKEDWQCMAVEFPRNRAKFDAIYDAIIDMNEIFRESGIKAHYDGYGETAE